MKINISPTQHVLSVQGDQAHVALDVQLFDDEGVAVPEKGLRVLEGGELVSSTCTDITGNAEIRLIFDVIAGARKQIQLAVGSGKTDAIIVLDITNPQVAEALVMAEFRQLMQVPNGADIAIFATRHTQEYPVLVDALNANLKERRIGVAEIGRYKECYPVDKNGLRILERPDGKKSLFKGTDQVGEWYEMVRPVKVGSVYVAGGKFTNAGDKYCILDKNGAMQCEWYDIIDDETAKMSDTFQVYKGTKGALMQVDGQIVSGWFERGWGGCSCGDGLFNTGFTLLKYIPSLNFWLPSKELDNGYLVSRQDGKVTIADSHGNIGEWVDKIEALSPNMHLVMDKGSSTLVASGKTATPVKATLPTISHRIFRTQLEDGKWVFMNDRGDVLTEAFASAELTVFNKGLFLMQGDNQCRIVNPSGEVGSAWYKNIYTTETPGVFQAQLPNDKFILINGENGVLTEEFDIRIKSPSLRAGMFMIKKDGRVMLLSGGKRSSWYMQICKTEVDGIFSAQLEDGRWVLINGYSVVVLIRSLGKSPITISRFNKDLLLMRAEGICCLAKNDGIITSASWYESIATTASPNLFYARSASGWILINDEKREITAPLPDPIEVTNFAKGLFLVKSGKYCFLIKDDCRTFSGWYRRITALSWPKDSFDVLSVDGDQACLSSNEMFKSRT